jgi:hypothetical protein
MIELKNDSLVVSFPGMPHKPAVSIRFQRTLRIPDDGQNYPLPPGLDSFPMRHIDDYAPHVPQEWLKRGGVLLPMWQSEALWLSFSSRSVSGRRADYPFAIKVATGKINAITGAPWRTGLARNPQDYLVVPEQPWLDGYCVEKGIIRQFVAMPLGQGYSVEEQLTGEAQFGGLQLEVFPMRPEVYTRRFPPVKLRSVDLAEVGHFYCCDSAAGMGLAPGGRMRQQIYGDPFSFDDWDTQHSSRCFIHLVNSATWCQITGSPPPSRPLTAEQYTAAGFPWFEYYDTENQAVNGSKKLAQLKTVNQKGKQLRLPLPDNQSLHVTHTVKLRAGLKPHQVRESDF